MATPTKYFLMAPKSSCGDGISEQALDMVVVVIFVDTPCVLFLLTAASIFGAVESPSFR